MGFWNNYYKNLTKTARIQGYDAKKIARKQKIGLSIGILVISAGFVYAAWTGALFVPLFWKYLLWVVVSLTIFMTSFIYFIGVGASSAAQVIWILVQIVGVITIAVFTAPFGWEFLIIWYGLILSAYVGILMRAHKEIVKRLKKPEEPEPPFQLKVPFK